MSRLRDALALVSGVLFGAGLIVGGMTQPAKVVQFLDVAGAWDPSLAFVMGGAVLVNLPLLRLIARRGRPLWGDTLCLPTQRDLDAKLVGGAALFGIGWGLGGFCPGPGITSLGSGDPKAFTFVAAMVTGFVLKRAWDARRHDGDAPAPRSAKGQAA